MPSCDVARSKIYRVPFRRLPASENSPRDWTAPGLFSCGRLLGRPLLGHVIAERAGHAMHAALVARIMSDPTLYEIITFDQLASRVTQALVS